eukprot:Rmarinus@m.18008
MTDPVSELSGGGSGSGSTTFWVDCGSGEWIFEDGVSYCMCDPGYYGPSCTELTPQNKLLFSSELLSSLEDRDEISAQFIFVLESYLLDSDIGSFPECFVESYVDKPESIHLTSHIFPGSGQVALDTAVGRLQDHQAITQHFTMYSSDIEFVSGSVVVLETDFDPADSSSSNEDSAWDTAATVLAIFLGSTAVIGVMVLCYKIYHHGKSELTRPLTADMQDNYSSPFRGTINIG